MLKIWVYLCCFFWSMGDFTASGSVVLIVNNVTLSFDDIEANFAPSIKQSGKCGTLYVAEPLDACSPLANKIVPKFNDSKSPFVLIIRGVCSFEDKIRRAQVAGFKAAIVYDEEDGDLIAMAGNAAGIKIHALFVSKASGETLAKYAGTDDVELWIFPNLENSAWSICVISFISLLAMSAVLATCFFMRRHRTRREHPQAPRVREFHGMSSLLVKAMPSLTFTAVLEDNCTSRTCAICLEDYNVGEKLRILPCRHKFHAICVDAWLTTWRTFCPVCKRDAMASSNGEKPASESTPLLSSSSSVSISVSSPFSSSVRSSSAIQISPPTLYNNQHSLQSHNQSPQLGTSQSSSVGHLRYISSQQSQLSRYMSSYISSPRNGSSSYAGSSSRQINNLLHYNSESAASFSPFASDNSLPEC